MDYNHKAEERKIYFHYFRVWMILAAIAVVAFGIMALVHKDDPERVIPERNNDKSPVQRVYDYADVLSQDDEEYLEDVIATCEKKSQCDLIVVTINQEVGLSDEAWTEGMVHLADDFYDQNAFGYDQPYGDGALLLDNWYHAGQEDSQAGTWLSTSGKLEYAIGPSEEKSVFRALDDGFEISTVDAYAQAIKKVAQYGMDDAVKEPFQFPWWLVFVLPAVIALIYMASNMSQSPGVDTTSSTTYVPGGQPHIRSTRDDFLRKTVSKVKIETESSSRSGGGGSYGHHTSSGGHSHGGGGHRR